MFRVLNMVYEVERFCVVFKSGIKFKFKLFIAFEERERHPNPEIFSFDTVIHIACSRRSDNGAQRKER